MQLCRMTIDPPSDVARVSEDFGHIRRGRPSGILTPTSPEDVVVAVRDAAAAGSKLTVRGLAHSAGGQSVASESAVVDVSRMATVGPVDPQRKVVRCEAGSRLRDVVSATLKHRLIPRALTNLLDLTVGGILSVGGGIGQGSHRYGPVRLGLGVRSAHGRAGTDGVSACDVGLKTLVPTSRACMCEVSVSNDIGKKEPTSSPCERALLCHGPGKTPGLGASATALAETREKIDRTEDR